MSYQMLTWWEQGQDQHIPSAITQRYNLQTHIMSERTMCCIVNVIFPFQFTNTIILIVYYFCIANFYSVSIILHGYILIFGLGFFPTTSSEHTFIQSINKATVILDHLESNEIYFRWSWTASLVVVITLILWR